MIDPLDLLIAADRLERAEKNREEEKERRLPRETPENHRCLSHAESASSFPLKQVHRRIGTRRYNRKLNERLLFAVLQRILGESATTTTTSTDAEFTSLPTNGGWASLDEHTVYLYLQRQDPEFERPRNLARTTCREAAVRTPQMRRLLVKKKLYLPELLESFEELLSKVGGAEKSGAPNSGAPRRQDYQLQSGRLVPYAPAASAPAASGELTLTPEAEKFQRARPRVVLWGLTKVQRLLVHGVCARMGLGSFTDGDAATVPLVVTYSQGMI